MSTRINRDALQHPSGDQGRHAGRQVACSSSILRNRVLEVHDVLIHLQSTQVGDGVGANLFLVHGLIGGDPQHARGLQFTGMLRHLGGHDFQKWVCIRYLGTPLESCRGTDVVPFFHIID